MGKCLSSLHIKKMIVPLCVCVCVCTVGRLSGSTFVCLCFFFVFEWKEIAGEDIRRTFNTTYSVLSLFSSFLLFITLVGILSSFLFTFKKSSQKKETSLFVCEKSVIHQRSYTHTPSNSITKVEIQDKSFKYRQFVENVQIKCLSVIFVYVCCVCVCPTVMWTRTFSFAISWTMDHKCSLLLSLLIIKKSRKTYWSSFGRSKTDYTNYVIFCYFLRPMTTYV